jgi:hypothetical protein
MGLLDDAIREHLDLKRRRGADPTDIERAEQEALGPVRRSPEEPQAFEDENGAPPTFDHEVEGEPFDHEDDEHVAPRDDLPAAADDDDPFADEPERPLHELIAEEHEPFLEESAEPEAGPEPRADRDPEAPSGIQLREPEDDELDGEPPEPASPRRRDEYSGEETVEYEVEAEFAEEHANSGKGDEDPLEETPEFLQDTPEHDRLWFEQRPPKDFDFDG